MNTKSRTVKDKRNAKEMGFLLATSYLLLSVLSIFSLALFSRENVYFQVSERNRNKIVAFNMAEAGLDQAITQLRLDANYTGTGTYTSLSTATIQGGYQATITTPQDNPNIRQIVTSGFSPSNVVTNEAYETRAITSFAVIEPPSLFKYGVFAKNSIQLNGSTTVIIDSYDSSIAPYNAAAPGLQGDIGTNSIAAGSVSLTGNVQVKGSATVGPGGDPLSIITQGPNTTITGSLSAASSAEDFEPATATGTSLGSLSIGGSTNYELPAGTYTASSLSISGSGKLTTLGPVSLYVTGTVDIAGNGVATSGNLPKNFLLFATSDASVSLSGNSNFYGAIYAPLSEVSNTGNGGLFGAMVSKTYQQSGNGQLHFDVDLKKVKGIFNNEVTLLSWRETNTTAGS